ncbi:hypothetical protein RDE2_51760 (plasmid) [Rhodococcus sp. RDE2]|nr:hypothetical protein RDE2_51760 [Rhodococcus sp. RDE2]
MLVREDQVTHLIEVSEVLGGQVIDLGGVEGLLRIADDLQHRDDSFCWMEDAATVSYATFWCCTPTADPP